MNIALYLEDDCSKGSRMGYVLEANDAGLDEDTAEAIEKEIKGIPKRSELIEKKLKWFNFLC